MRLKIATYNQWRTVRRFGRKPSKTTSPRRHGRFGDTIDTDCLTREEELAVRLAADMADDPHEFTDDVFQELREVYSGVEISELLTFAGVEVGLDRFCIALTLDTAEESDYPTNPEYPADPEP